MQALIVTDIQNDFMPGGALAVPEGDLIIPIVNELMEQVNLVAATQDWHPASHGSFAANHPGRVVGDVIDLGGQAQILWPVHCVQKTAGAALHPQLRLDRVAQIFYKGTDPEIDSYSTFFDNGHRQSTGLDQYLKTRGIDEVFLVGVATDFCVKYSALDAARLGFRTRVIEDACRGIERQTGDVARAMEKMRAAGIKIMRSTDLLNPFKPVFNRRWEGRG